jgi:chromate transporter
LVVRRRWLDDRAYADLVALCQFLPGPASSQVGFALGMMRAGWAGALAAFVAFTLPSALILLGFALTGTQVAGPLGAGALQGLKIVAVAIVAQAVWGMARQLCPDRERAAIAVLAVVLLAFVPGSAGMVAAIAAGAAIGLALGRDEGRSSGRSDERIFHGSSVVSSVAFMRRQTIPSDCKRLGPASDHAAMPVSPLAGAAAILLFAALLVALPSLAQISQAFAVFDGFYRAGALVFGGGHVVLPLLDAEVVQSGWVAPDIFLAGYGAAQGVPGPLFTFAAYLGAVLGPEPNGVAGAGLALAAIFLPGFLLLVGVLPFWQRFRAIKRAQSLMQGANAAVVGILAAALYSPVFTTAVADMRDLALALALFVALTAWRVPPWAVVGLGALGGMALTLIA